jgi:hypothetical protein
MVPAAAFTTQQLCKYISAATVELQQQKSCVFYVVLAQVL